MGRGPVNEKLLSRLQETCLPQRELLIIIPQIELEEGRAGAGELMLEHSGSVRADEDGSTSCRTRKALPLNSK